MSYATLEYYKTTFEGQSISDDDTQKWLDRSADDIDLICGYGFDFEDLSSFQQELIKKANCYQAENYIKNGDEELSYNNLSIGQFSISGSTEKKYFSRKGYSFLANAGVLFRGVKCNQYREVY